MKIFLFSILIILFTDFKTSCQEFQNGSRWISAENGLRIRDKPNQSAKKLGVIPFGEKVNWLAENDEIVYLAGTHGKWTKIKWGETIGWVYGGFLSEMNPEQSEAEIIDDINRSLTTFYSDKWEESISFCRVELIGYGFTLTKKGSIKKGNNEFDIKKTYRYEKGISVLINQGYKMGGRYFEFDAELYTVEEVFALACSVYTKKYKAYLDYENDQFVLPSSSESWNRTLESFQSTMEGDTFKSFRIDEVDACNEWWYFEIQNGLIRFGEGGGC